MIKAAWRTQKTTPAGLLPGPDGGIRRDGQNSPHDHRFSLAPASTSRGPVGKATSRPAPHDHSPRGRQLADLLCSLNRDGRSGPDIGPAVRIWRCDPQGLPIVSGSPDWHPRLSGLACLPLTEATASRVMIFSTATGARAPAELRQLQSFDALAACTEYWRARPTRQGRAEHQKGKYPGVRRALAANYTKQPARPRRWTSTCASATRRLGMEC
jgi:hypothetical protein